MNVEADAELTQLATTAIALEGIDDLEQAETREDRTRIIAGIILGVFDDYYHRSRRIPYLAKIAFETRNWPETTRLSRVRLAIYGKSVTELAAVLGANWPKVPDVQSFWVEVEANYLAGIRGRPEADLAFAFMRSTRRLTHQGEWAPVAYSAGAADALAAGAGETVSARFECSYAAPASTIAAVLDIPRFNAPFRDLDGDAALVAAEINAALARNGGTPSAGCRLEMIDAGFFRNRGVYLVGRLHPVDGPDIPIAIALLNEKDGIFVDAVLTSSDELHQVFSSALANFHVTSERYHDLARFLFELMPRRPLGLHYSTIGFNHVGKVAVMKELKAEHQTSGEAIDFAVGFRGTVAIGFSMPCSRYVAKVIRDHPTEGYKWGAFQGVQAVLDKYRIVHESDRAGSMLDNVMYDNVRLERSWFADGLLAELITAASNTVSVQGNHVLFKHLIVQMKMVPLPEFLEAATPEEARAAVINLGYCIKNNAAANIFNKDLDGRNYGVARSLKVFLFDYDAVEHLTDVKVRTNVGREEGEEDIPDWYFEDGVIFLPEETLSGLRIDDPDLRRLFRETHWELLTVDYWEGMQRALREGKVPKVRSYPASRRLKRREPAATEATPGSAASLATST